MRIHRALSCKYVPASSEVFSDTQMLCVSQRSFPKLRQVRCHGLQRYVRCRALTAGTGDWVGDLGLLISQIFNSPSAPPEASRCGSWRLKPNAVTCRNGDMATTQIPGKTFFIIDWECRQTLHVPRVKYALQQRTSCTVLNGSPEQNEVR